MGTGYKSQIANKLKERINLVKVANGYPLDVVTVEFDKVKLNISDYADYELPAVQLIDLSRLFTHVRTKSDTSWFIAVEMCMRTTETLGIVDQQTMWDFEESVVQCIMAKPQLDLPFVRHVKLVDSVTDLHLQEPNYLSTIGLEIMFHEKITADC